MALSHTKVLAVADGGDTTKARPSDWNAPHVADANGVEHVVGTGTPSTPASGRALHYLRTLAGKLMAHLIGEDGFPRPLQEAVWNKRIAWADLNPSTTLTQMGLVLTATGTATAKAVATTNSYTRMRALEYLVTTAATTAVAGWRTAASWWRGNAANLGGFFFKALWGPATGPSTTTNLRAFVGLIAATGAPTDVDPSTLVDCVGMGWDDTDTNVSIIHNDSSGTATMVDLGASFPVPTTDRTETYELVLFAQPNGSSIQYRVTRTSTGAEATGTLSTNLPTAGTLLCAKGYCSVGGTSSVVGIGLGSLYIESRDEG